MEIKTVTPHDPQVPSSDSTTVASVWYRLLECACLSF